MAVIHRGYLDSVSTSKIKIFLLLSCFYSIQSDAAPALFVSNRTVDAQPSEAREAYNKSPKRHI